jgi:hypothetical protein
MQIISPPKVAEAKRIGAARPQSTTRGALLCRLLAAALACVVALPVAAQEDYWDFEITPIAAYRFGGQFEEEDDGQRFKIRDSSAQGLVFNFAGKTDDQFELLYARQRTEVDTRSAIEDESSLDIDVEYLHFGGTILFEGHNVRPFMAVTAGLTRFDPRPGEYSSEEFWSLSIGGGLYLRREKTVGVRLEGRMFTTLVDDSSNIFCVSASGSGFCGVTIQGSLLTQWELRAGLVFRF